MKNMELTIVWPKAIDAIKQIYLMVISNGIKNIDNEGAGNIIQARINQSFFIALDSLPTAGYNWTVSFDSQFLRLDNERFQSSQPQAIGSGGQQIFTFIPLRTGSTEVTAVYRRPWESKVEEERKFIVQISE